MLLSCWTTEILTWNQGHVERLTVRSSSETCLSFLSAPCPGIIFVGPQQLWLVEAHTHTHTPGVLSCTRSFNEIRFHSCLFSPFLSQRPSVSTSVSLFVSICMSTSVNNGEQSRQIFHREALVSQADDSKDSYNVSSSVATRQATKNQEKKPSDTKHVFLKIGGFSRDLHAGGCAPALPQTQQTQAGTENIGLRQRLFLFLKISASVCSALPHSVIRIRRELHLMGYHEWTADGGVGGHTLDDKKNGLTSSRILFTVSPFCGETDMYKYTEQNKSQTT